MVYECLAGGVFRSAKRTIQYVILDYHTTAVTWSAGTRINCEFFEDLTTFREMSGEKERVETGEIASLKILSVFQRWRPYIAALRLNRVVTMTTDDLGLL